MQQELDRDVDLESLARRFGASSFHFHRTFAAEIGETPKKHVQRRRLEKAALLVAVTDEPILEISLAVGFRNPETFARNFRKAFGYSPSGYRRMAKAAQAERLERVDFFGDERYSLSRAKFELIPPMHLLAVRHMGSYGALNETFADACNPWSELMRDARDAGLTVGAVPVGIFYDDPTMTPESLQRCDVCVSIAGAVGVALPLRRIELERGWYAVTEYVGRVETLLNAFRGLADEIRRSDRFVFRDGPAVEILRASNLNGERGVHRMDLCFPVRKLDARRGA